MADHEATVHILYNRPLMADILSDCGFINTGWTDTHGAGRADIYLVKVGPDIIGIEQKESCQNYACPFRLISFPNRIQIKYFLPHKDNIKVKIYYINGRIVVNLLDELREAGDHILTLNRRILQGVYFIHLETSNQTYRAKTVIVR
jgi:hypothetical protein